MQDSPFISQRRPKPPSLLIASTHREVARLSWPDHLEKVVTNPSTKLGSINAIK